MYDGQYDGKKGWHGTYETTGNPPWSYPNILTFADHEMFLSILTK